jgi:thiamine-monophosphate kinase
MSGDGDEFSLIDALAARFSAGSGGLAPGDMGIGDDAAAVTLPGLGRVVMATDLVVAGVHVDLAVSTPEDIGWKALMVTVSDLGAMGCAPSHVLLSVAAPAGFPVERLGDGVAQAAEATGCTVVGGDLSSSTLLVVSVVAVGPADDNMRPLLTRSGARPGDLLFVTGPLGASAAGLRLLGDPASAGASGTAALFDTGTLHPLAVAHRRPMARIREGMVARAAGATACIDVSDGLVADVNHVADASVVGLDLVVGAPVVAEGATRYEALVGGEDYELVIATADPDTLVAAFEGAGLRPPLAIGRCTDVGSGRLLDGGALPAGGWRHRF